MNSESFIKATTEGKLISRMYYGVKGRLGHIAILVSLCEKKIGIRSVTRKTPIDPLKIIFLTFDGEYSCNPKYICEEIIKQNKNWKLVWGTRVNTNMRYGNFPEKMIFAVRESYEFYKEIASAKVIIDNGISTSFLGYRKKKDQVLIETWHGSLGIKKFSPDTVKDKTWIRQAYVEGQMTDYIISNSSFESELYNSTYWKNTKILEYGHARNDILFKPEDSWGKDVREKVRNIYGLGKEVHICMYAPTFRDTFDKRLYLIGYEELLAALENKFGGEWVIFTRFHFKTKKYLKKEKFPEKVINVSDYPDIQELMTCIDVGITDYSSWICEYMLRHKAGFIYAPDYKEYQNRDRELLFPLEKLPFPIATSFQKTLENIIEFNEEKYVNKVDLFLKEMGSTDSGNAANKVVDLLSKILE